MPCLTTASLPLSAPASLSQWQSAPACWSLLQAASAYSLLLEIVYIEIFASIFQKFSIVVTAQQTARICQTIFNKVLSCILLLYLELKSSTNRPVFAFELFLYKSESAGHISHSHICRTTKLPGWPNICSKLGIRKQFCVFGEAVTGSVEWSAVRKLGIRAKCSSLSNLWLVSLTPVWLGTRYKCVRVLTLVLLQFVQFWRILNINLAVWGWARPSGIISNQDTGVNIKFWHSSLLYFQGNYFSARGTWFDFYPCPVPLGAEFDFYACADPLRWGWQTEWLPQRAGYIS